MLCHMFTELIELHDFELLARETLETAHDFAYR